MEPVRLEREVDYLLGDIWKFPSKVINKAGLIISTSLSPSNYWVEFNKRAACIAEREWNAWQQGSIHETNPNRQSFLKKYFEAAHPNNITRAHRRATNNLRRNSKKRSPWSAAFISYVMKEAGAGNFFKYNSLHFNYMRAARSNREESRRNPFQLFRPAEIKPEVGDLVCNWRGTPRLSYDNLEAKYRRFLDTRDYSLLHSHCDIVVEIGIDNNGNKVAWVIGGNTRNKTGRPGERNASTVGKKPRKLTLDGFLKLKRDDPIFAILKVRTDLNLPKPSGVQITSCSQNLAPNGVVSRPVTKEQKSLQSPTIKTFNFSKKSNISLKKINVERKKIDSKKMKDLFLKRIYNDSDRSLLNLLFVSTDKIIKEFPTLDTTVISYKIESRDRKEDVRQFRNAVKPDFIREKRMFTRSNGANIILDTLTETDVIDISKMGFKTHSNALHYILISFPRRIKEFLIGEENVLDKFEFNKSQIRSFHKEKLEALGRYIRYTWRNHSVSQFNPVKAILIDGYTDLVGKDEYNVRLSEKRATEVYNYLKKFLGPIKGIEIHIVPQGESDPVESTTGRSESNRRVQIGLTYYDRVLDEDLKKLKGIILNEVKKDRKIKGTDIEKEIKCIASKLTYLNYDDRFFMYTSPNDKYNEYLLPHLRTVLLKELLLNTPNKEIYNKLKFHIDLIKFEARKVAAIHAKYALGGGSGINRNDAKRMDFINDRICSKNPPSLIGCLKGFETEGAFWINRPC
ncbi:MAG: DUF2272 domain-containing protein [Maribacter sp.]|nr:DUF2272 domain-containing protein [Maribacter sp.]